MAIPYERMPTRGNQSNPIITQSNTPRYFAIKITEVAPITYVAMAVPGTLQAAAKWQCKKIDETSGLIITFADGNDLFDNVATNLASLTYS